MSQEQKQWLLKVIVGPHQGAEISLDEGKALIGSDDECDVVLHDILIAPQHLALELTRSGIIAAPLGGRVYANGKRLREARQPVQDFTILSIGSTHLVVGPQEGKWPLLSAADVPELEKDAPEPDADNTKSEDSSQPSTPETAAKPASTTSQPSRRAAWFGVLLGCLLLIGWLVVWRNFVADKLPSPKQQTAMDLALQVLEQTGTTKMINLEEKSGKITATGYVTTDMQQREVQSGLRAAVPGARTRVWSLEKVAASARALLAAQRLPLAVTPLQEGELRITGTLTDNETWDRVRQMLLVEIPGISGLDDQVKINAIKPALISAAPVSPPAPAPTPAAPLTAAPLTAAPLPAPPSEKPLLNSLDTPDSIVAIISPRKNGLGWMKLNTGGIYFVGGELPLGGTITTIANDSIAVQELDLERHILRGEKIGSRQSSTTITPLATVENDSSLP